MIRNIVIIVAMEQESLPFINRWNLKENIPSPFERGSPMISYSGVITSKLGTETCINLIWNGKCRIHSCNHVATTAAGVSTYAAISVFKPDLVISAGTAGGFSELGAGIGDVYISTKCVFHNRLIPIAVSSSLGTSGADEVETPLGNETADHLPLAGEGRRKQPLSPKHKLFEEYGFGHFRSPPLLGLTKVAQIKQGVVSSSDSLDCSPTDLQILRSEGAVVKEMEAAGVGWVCQQLSRPFFALKSVTDIVDGDKRTEDEFYANLLLASDALQDKLSAVIWNIGGTSLHQWAVDCPHTDTPANGGPTANVSSTESVGAMATTTSLSSGGIPAAAAGPAGVSRPEPRKSPVPPAPPVLGHQSNSSYSFTISKDFVHGFVVASVLSLTAGAIVCMKLQPDRIFPIWRR